MTARRIPDLRSPLPRAFFEQPTLDVSHTLLGARLVRETADDVITGRIVEVEAYVGFEDRASHASRGRTKRTEVMFGEAGIAYVYLIYGMHHCLNVVTEHAGYPAAILIRGIEWQEPPAHSTRMYGPGRICRHFRVDRLLNGCDLTAGVHLWIEAGSGRMPGDMISAYPRIGVAYAGEWAHTPWRFRLESPGS
jgi:DNA-3-methyladenine glycosylase